MDDVVENVMENDRVSRVVDPSLPPKRILIASGKGGSGKTTTARNLAVAAAHQGLSVTTIDMDESPTLSRWWTNRPDDMPEINHLQAPVTEIKGDIYKELVALRGAELLIIDSPPALGAYPVLATAVLRAADLIIVPAQQYSEDLDAVAAWVAILREQRRTALLLLNNTHRREISFEMAKRRLIDMGSARITLCPVDIPHAADIPKTTSRGLGVVDINGAKGAADYEAVFNHIRKMLEI